MITMIMKIIPGVLAAASVLPIVAQAQFTLSDMTMYSATPNGAQIGSSLWNTRGDDLQYNVYMFTGTISSPSFFNSGNSDATLNPNLSLGPGVHVIQFTG